MQMKSNTQRPRPDNSNRILLKYAGLGTQIIVALGLAVFFGLKLDEKFRFSFPLLVWVLPLLVITAIIIKVIRDTSNKK